MGPRERHWRSPARPNSDVCEENVGAYFKRVTNHRINAIPVFLHRHASAPGFVTSSTRNSGLKDTEEPIGGEDRRHQLHAAGHRSCGIMGRATMALSAQAEQHGWSIAARTSGLEKTKELKILS